MQEKQMPSTPKRILIVMAHPGSNSLTQALAEEYQRGAIKSGAEVRYLSLSELDFDPVLKEGYRGKQPMEPDLTKAQKDILWAQHLVFVYPIWWGAMPALLKGFIDRIFLPGFAFKYRKDSVWWDKLLAGRSARLITLMDTPPCYFRWVYRMPGHNQMKRTILEFCGVKPVRISSFGPVRGADEKQRENWLRKVYQTGLQQA
jgi:putative NADPH-quinone reductase